MYVSICVVCSTRYTMITLTHANTQMKDRQAGRQAGRQTDRHTDRHIHTYTYTHMCTHTNIHTYTHVCTHTYTHTNTHRSINKQANKPSSLRDRDPYNVLINRRLSFSSVLLATKSPCVPTTITGDPGTLAYNKFE